MFERSDDIAIRFLTRYAMLFIALGDRAVKTLGNLPNRFIDAVPNCVAM